MITACVSANTSINICAYLWTFIIGTFLKCDHLWYPTCLAANWVTHANPLRNKHSN